MNRNQLHHSINTDYSPENRRGIEKGRPAKFQHIYFVIPPSIPEMIRMGDYGDQARLAAALTKGHRALNAMKPLDEMDAVDKLMSRLLASSEALASSRMEGTFSTIHEVLDPSALTEASPETRSVIGYAHALEAVFDKLSTQQHKAVDQKLFADIHVEIAKHDKSYSGRPGEYRTGDEYVWIGGFRIEDSIYNPAPPHHVPWLMENCISWISDINVQEEGDAGITRRLTLPIRMALAHAHFEAIHPFSDGNGRVGRCIWPMQMILSGYSPLYLSGYVEAEKRSYMDALEAFQKRLELLPMIEFIGDALKDSLQEAVASRKALSELSEQWRAKVVPRKNSAADRLLKHLLGQPIIMVKDVMTMLSVSEPAAWRAVHQLETAGILEETTGMQRDRRYSACDVLSILGRPFGSSADMAVKSRKR